MFKNRIMWLLIAIIFFGSMAVLPVAAESLTTIHKVRVRDFEFAQDTITVEVGDKVGWGNFGEFSHTVTNTDGSWDSGVLSTGEQFRIRPQQAGTITYLCTIHPSMTGTIIVVEPEAN